MSREENVESKEAEMQKYELERRLDKLGEGSALLWLVFALAAIPTLFNGLHATSYIFLAEVPTHWCTVAELSAANWTESQIRNVSSASSCLKYSYDYSYLAGLSFDDALAYAEANRDVATEECTAFSYADDTDGTSIVVKQTERIGRPWYNICVAFRVGISIGIIILVMKLQWDLVCDRTVLRSSVQMALSLGKFLGATLFGVIADKCGRRVSYVAGILLLIVCGPANAFAPWYWLFMILRGLIGASNSAIYHSAFTILSEVASPKHRAWMGIVYSMGYPLGTMLLPALAYWTKDWQNLQLVMTIPALILLPNCWFMPESPRWLISEGRYLEAKLIIDKYSIPSNTSKDQLTLDMSKREVENQCMEIAPQPKTIGKQTFWKKFNSFTVIYTNTELLWRILIAYVTWAASSLSYYAIALNVDNFSANRYIYIFLTGLSELPAYVLPLPLLAVMGRRTVSVLLFHISGVALICILIIPQTNTTAVMVVALVGRLTIAAVFCVIIVHTSELFPTIARNSAVGTSSTMAHIGSISAPYVVDILGEKAWWAPSTLCGITAIIAGILSTVLPETRGRSLADTVEEEIAEERGRVSVRNCCSCK